MVRKKCLDLGNEPSAIRALFLYGQQRAEQIGRDHVFDFSIGNPSVPAPHVVQTTIQELIQQDPVLLHTYSDARGFESTRQTVARHIERMYGIPAKAEQVYMCSGAAAGLAISLQAITVPGEEVIVLTPFFPEYRVWVEQSQCTLVEVPCSRPSFQLDVSAIQAAITPKTAAIIINSPNNPTGAVYSEDSLLQLANVLHEKEKEYGTNIYLIADEPYREITYGAKVPYVPCMYDRCIVCYSLSKSLSLPGERVGYIYVNNLMNNADEVSLAIQGAGRALGYVCCGVLFQRVLEKCIDQTSNVSDYAKNRDLLTAELSQIGYEFVQPDGAFYLWMKSLEANAQAFSDCAKEYDLLLVPSDSFGCGGYVRISYCVSRKTIENSIPAFRKLFERYQQPK